MKKPNANPKPKPATPKSEAFAKRTISLPTGLMDRAVVCAAAPRYAGNLSAFLRDVLIQHLEGAQAK